MIVLTVVLGCVLLLGLFIYAALRTPDEAIDFLRNEALDLLHVIAAACRWIWNAGRRAKRKPRAVRRRRGGRHVAAADHGDITEAEHEQAVAYALARYGHIPPSKEATS